MRYLYKALFEFDGQQYSPGITTNAPRVALCYKSRAHVWNMLGVKGQRMHESQVGHALYKDARRAEIEAEKMRKQTFGAPENLSNEIGNNDHLSGLSYYERVEVVPVKIVPRDA